MLPKPVDVHYAGAVDQMTSHESHLDERAHVDCISSGHKDARAVDQMTSREFHMDERAHLDCISKKLKDAATMEIFHKAIMQNKHLFRGRVVVDVGCDIGILSLFAAKAGAARVYAIDWSNTVDYARRVADSNGYADVICVLKGRVREVELPTSDKVDIIVSNWMGYSLLSQSICDEVLDARDKWLREDGLIFPDEAKLYVMGFEDHKHRGELFNWWKNVYSFNMNCIAERVVYEPCLQRVHCKQVITSYYCIKKLNLNTATKSDLLFRTMFRLDVSRSGCMDGLVTFFHAIFSKAHKPMAITTDPKAPYTRWVQSVFYFKEGIHVPFGREIYGGIEMISAHGNGTLNLNDVVVNLELNSCEANSDDFQLELEMSWRMKPSWLLDTAEGNPHFMEAQTKENTTLPASKKNETHKSFAVNNDENKKNYQHPSPLLNCKTVEKELLQQSLNRSANQASRTFDDDVVLTYAAVANRQDLQVSNVKEELKTLTFHSNLKDESMLSRTTFTNPIYDCSQKHYAKDESRNQTLYVCFGSELVPIQKCRRKQGKMKRSTKFMK